MQDANPTGNDFLKRITGIIGEHISDEQFGVSELAGRIGMSRSNLLRRVSKLTGLSVSQFIRQVRLKKAMELLREGSLNVSEVTFRVGFNSTSYFIKCFREHFGYPPGEARDHPGEEPREAEQEQGGRRWRYILLSAVALLLLLCIVLLIVVHPFKRSRVPLERSIAVMPFVNDSNDSSNVYLINGIMEALLDNLQQIEDLRVISRTSAEKYRYLHKTAPEIARELDVNYLVEGSGQKIGDQILLHIQLIEASSDRHLWARHYKREATDVFYLQMEVAKSIAGEIKAIITPEEEERINMIPTEDPVAYDYYLQGLDLYFRGTLAGLEACIPVFQQAIDRDPSFANPYAYISIAYSLMEWGRSEKQHAEQANSYADQALLYNPELAQSLVAKAAFYINSRSYAQALPHLEKALEYHPNSAMIVNILADFYTNYVPDSRKYLEYALKGIRLDIGSQDSVNASYTCLHASNALLQFGFVDEALAYINRSLGYNPENIFAKTLKAYILFAMDGDLERTREMLLAAMDGDSTQVDLVQELGKVCYFLRDYECARGYYGQLLKLKGELNLDVYRGEDAKIAYVYEQAGLAEASDSLYRKYRVYAENDNSVYKYLSLAVYDANHQEPERAMEHLARFSQQDHYLFLIFPFLEMDPLMDPVRDLPAYQEIIRSMESRFWREHNRIRETLEIEGLI